MIVAFHTILLAGMIQLFVFPFVLYGMHVMPYLRKNKASCLDALLRPRSICTICKKMVFISLSLLFCCRMEKLNDTQYMYFGIATTNIWRHQVPLFTSFVLSLMASENFVSCCWPLVRANEDISFLVMNPPRLFDPLSFV